MAYDITGRRQGSTKGDAARGDRRNATTLARETRERSPRLKAPPRAWATALKGGGVRWFEHIKRVRLEAGDPYRRVDADAVCALAVALHALETTRAAQAKLAPGGKRWLLLAREVDKRLMAAERLRRAAGFIPPAWGAGEKQAPPAAAGPFALPEPAPLPPSLRAVP